MLTVSFEEHKFFKERTIKMQEMEMAVLCMALGAAMIAGLCVCYGIMNLLRHTFPRFNAWIVERTKGEFQEEE